MKSLAKLISSQATTNEQLLSDTMSQSGVKIYDLGQDGVTAVFIDGSQISFNAQLLPISIV